MAKRAIHYDDWDGGTEADQDHPEHSFCGTEGPFEPLNLTTASDQVTCKRCLKILAAAAAERAAEKMKYKAELYDEVWARAKAMGFMNVTTALDKLAKDAEFHTQVQRAAGELPEGWMITVSVERDGGWIDLTTPDGTIVETCADGHLSEQVSDAIETALETA